jgi:glutaredoxin/glutathione-dependent peroxiredoxin
MTIQIGEPLPKASFTVMGPDGPAVRSTEQIFKGKKIVLFGVAGAFTPICDKNHLPGFLSNLRAFKARGTDDVAVTSVNDVFVMDAWAKSSGAEGKILFFLTAMEILPARSGSRLILRRAASAFARSAMR